MDQYGLDAESWVIIYFLKQNLLVFCGFPQFLLAFFSVDIRIIRSFYAVWNTKELKEDRIINNIYISLRDKMTFSWKIPFFSPAV
jgi:hypothetical protein